MDKLLSFAIPCYNSAEYMEHCINTVIAGGDEVEVIIVDDGSTKDNTYEIAKRYEKEYPDIVKAVHQENGCVRKESMVWCIGVKCMRFWRYIKYLQNSYCGPVAQLVRAPPCHGGGRRFDPDPGRFS